MDKEAHFEQYENTPTGNMDIELFYQKMKEENKLKKVFYDGSVKCLQDFTKIATEQSWFYFGFDNYKMVGGVWFTDFLEKSCKIHFCSFRGYKADNFKEPIIALTQFILDNDSFECYKIIGCPPYKGIAVMFQSYGFEYKGFFDNKYIVEKTR